MGVAVMSGYVFACKCGIALGPYDSVAAFLQAPGQTNAKRNRCCCKCGKVVEWRAGFYWLNRKERRQLKHAGITWRPIGDVLSTV